MASLRCGRETGTDCAQANGSATLEVDVARAMMANPELVVVATFPTRTEADLAEGALHAHGINAIVSGDDASGIRPDLGVRAGFRLLVRAEDRGDANDVLGLPTT